MGDKALYSESDLPIRAAITEAHAATLASMTRPGRWFGGAERAAIAEHARDARVSASLQLHTAVSSETATVTPAVEKVARRVAVSTNDLDKSFLEEAQASGLSDEAYCEVVGLVSRLCAIDVFARGIGVKPRPLGAVVSGEPSHERPQTAIEDGAWIASVPGGRRGKSEAVDIYGTDKVEGAPFIYRALSLVPEEAKSLVELGRAHYLQIENFMDMNFTYEPEISRMQVELLAARVSAINECFY